MPGPTESRSIANKNVCLEISTTIFGVEASANFAATFGAFSKKMPDFSQTRSLVVDFRYYFLLLSVPYHRAHCSKAELELQVSEKF